MRPSPGTEYLVRTHDHGPIHLTEDLDLRGIGPAIEHAFEAISLLCDRKGLGLPVEFSRTLLDVLVVLEFELFADPTCCVCSLHVVLRHLDVALFVHDER